MKIEDLKLINYPFINEENGQLSIFESPQIVPFNIKRVFSVSANKGCIRGDHAHIACSQFLICLRGEIELNCKDGFGGEATINMNSKSAGVLIPPGIWASQRYENEESILLVFCDKEFLEKDYIRDYLSFISFVKENR